MTDACRCMVAYLSRDPDQSSLNSGKMCPLARPLTLPNFVALRQKLCEISAVENLCSRKSGPNFTKIGDDLLLTNVPSSCKISLRSRPNGVREKR